MSLFDKLKSGIKNVSDRVTGDYGEVLVKLAEPSAEAGEELEATVTLTAKSDFKYTKVLVTLVGREKVKFEARRGDDGEQLLTRDTTTRTFELTEEIEGEGELARGDTREVKAVLKLPPDIKPSFESKHFCHRYQLEVRVDIPWGVDLEAVQAVKVLSASPIKREPVNFERSDGCFYFRLKYSEKDCSPGDRLGYELEIGCMEEATVVATTFSIVAFNAIDCRMKQEAEDGDGFSVTDNERVHLPKHYTKEWVYDKGKKIEAGQMVRQITGLNLPKDLPTTYYGELCNSAMVLKCHVEVEGRKPLEASMNLMVHAITSEQKNYSGDVDSKSS